MRACLRKAWLSSRAFCASSPSATTTSTPSSRRMPRPRPGGLLGRVVAGDDDAPDAGGEDRVGARRRAAVVAARLERDVERRLAQVGAAAGGDRVDLGVGAAELVVPALAEDARRRRRSPRRRPGSGWSARRRCARARSRARGARGRSRCRSASHNEAYGGGAWPSGTISACAARRWRCSTRWAVQRAAVQLVDLDERPGPAVGGRVVVEGPVEVEADVGAPVCERRHRSARASRPSRARGSTRPPWARPRGRRARGPPRSSRSRPSRSRRAGRGAISAGESVRS